MYVKTLYRIDKENRDRGDHSHGVDNGAGGDLAADVEEMLNDEDEEFVSVFIMFPALSITVFGCIVTMYILLHLFSICGKLLWREDFDSLFCNRCEVSACVYGSLCF